jgi:hypothetical protein
MNSRSDSRFRYFSATGFVVSGSASYRAQALRSARRDTVRAWCRKAAPGVPPGRMNDVSFGRRSLNSSHQPSSRSTYFSVIRSGGYGGSSEIGRQRSAPTSKRSFCTARSTSVTSAGSPPAAIAKPSTEFVSSVSAYAPSRGDVLGTRDPSPSAVVPLSPTFVYTRLMRTTMKPP